ncbi:acyl-CoA thioesterase [Stieleria varia]|uniref:Acyl-CoA thioester hydrolase YbgC n=1 Tax=Stieleria varia TaxID=2528005 RepID=A0A5C6B1R7_9BACT|nr:thioesterase family protein [Stieleria varia]TWU05777.1 Acyl-CoA thioester hydrolase YbgC [Stieleria varia]
MRQHTIEHRVRYDECDPMGFVHHSIYLQYFEMGRTELLRAVGGRYREMEEAGQLVVVVRVDCRYRMPAKYDDLVQIHTEIKTISEAKIVHHYRVTRGEETLVTADVTMGMIDREGNLQRIPEGLIKLF